MKGIKTMSDKEIIHYSARLLKVLGDETRLTILKLLSKNEANVSMIVEKTGIEQSNISHQLKVLKEHRLVQSRREGKSIVYFPDDRHVYQILDQVFAHIKEDITEQ